MSKQKGKRNLGLFWNFSGFQIVRNIGFTNLPPVTLLAILAQVVKIFDLILLFCWAILRFMSLNNKPFCNMNKHINIYLFLSFVVCTGRLLCTCNSWLSRGYAWAERQYGSGGSISVCLYQLSGTVQWRYYSC